jgi:hypothetical protein
MNVAISEGVRLTDEDARRFAMHMLDDINQKSEHIWKTVLSGAALKNFSVGNPKGQKRTFNRIAREHGMLFLDGSLRTGTRKRFCFNYSTFAVTADGRHLELMAVRVECSGPNKDVDVGYAVLLVFTAHALQRLIQRSGVRKADDYLPILKALGMPGVLAAVSAKYNNGIPEGTVWPLPVSVNGVKSIMLLATMPNSITPVVVSVYKGEWRDYPAMRALEEELNFAVDDDMGHHVPFFLEAAKLFRKAA